jgi:hypothetical protein
VVLVLALEQKFCSLEAQRSATVFRRRPGLAMRPLFRWLSGVSTPRGGRHQRAKVVSSPLLDLNHQVENAPHFSDWRCHDSLSWVEMMMEGNEKEKKTEEKVAAVALSVVSVCVS